MAVPNSRIIDAPGPFVISMIKRHLPPDARKEIEGVSFDTIALINAIVPTIYFYADIAMKAGGVFASEMSGTCPQHTTTLALFGDVASVKAAMDAIESKSKKQGD